MKLFRVNRAEVRSTFLVYIFALFGVTAVLLLTLFVYVHATNKTHQALNDMHAAVIDRTNHCIGVRALYYPAECGSPWGKRASEYSQLGAVDGWSVLLSNGQDEDKNNSSSLMGDVGAKKYILLVGDSHATHFANAFDYIGKKYGYAIKLDSRGCIMDTTKVIGSQFASCNQDEETILGEMAGASKIIFSFVNNKQSATGRLEEFLKKAKAYSSKTYFMQDTPYAGSNGGPDCFLFHTDQCDNNLTDAYTPSNISLETILNSDNYVYSWIPTRQYFCQNSTCYTYIGGLPVYHDNGSVTDWINQTGNSEATIGNSHMTASFSYTLGLPLGEELYRMGVISN